MIQSLPPEKGSFDKDFKVFYDFVLTGEIFKVLRSYLSFKITIFGRALSPGIKIAVIAACKHDTKINIVFLNSPLIMFLACRYVDKICNAVILKHDLTKRL
jgi:hypothetical protein